MFACSAGGESGESGGQVGQRAGFGPAAEWRRTSRRIRSPACSRYLCAADRPLPDRDAGCRRTRSQAAPGGMPDRSFGWCRVVAQSTRTFG